jgi:hypothetical protein
VLRYLARYTHRVAISNRRLIACEEKAVTFKCKDYRIEGPERYKVMTLATHEFIRRFLIHVLPAGFHRIRYYGLLASGKRASEPSMNCRKRIRRCQNRGVTLPPGSARENPEACPSGIRHVGGAKLNLALVRNVRTCAPMQRERSQAAPTARLKVPMRRRGADCSVVVMKRGNARGAKGAGDRH